MQQGQDSVYWCICGVGPSQDLLRRERDVYSICGCNRLCKHFFSVLNANALAVNLAFCSYLHANFFFFFSDIMMIDQGAHGPSVQLFTSHGVWCWVSGRGELVI